MDCSYCSAATIEGRAIRKHDPEKVVETISKYTEAGMDHFFSVDNTFNLSSIYARHYAIADFIEIKNHLAMHSLSIES